MYFVCDGCMHLPQNDDDAGIATFEEYCVACGGRADIAQRLRHHLEYCPSNSKLVSPFTFFRDIKGRITICIAISRYVSRYRDIDDTSLDTSLDIVPDLLKANIHTIP